MLDGEDYLKATGRAPVVLVSPGTLSGLGLAAGQQVTLRGDTGSVSLPVGVADLPDGVAWTPTTSAWSTASGSTVWVTSADGATA